MKNLFLTVMLLVIGLSLTAVTIDLGTGYTGYEITSSSKTNLQMQYSLKQVNIEEINSKGGSFSVLTADKHTKTNNVGKPSLPLFRKLIAVPVGADVKINVKSLKSKAYELKNFGFETKIIPAQESIAKCEGAYEKAPFILNENVYNVDKFTDNDVVSVQYQGVLRGVNVYSVDINPVSYNPVKNAIRICTNVDFELNFENADLAKTIELRSKTANSEFEAIYNRFLINNNVYSTRNDITSYPTKMLIVSHSMFENTLQDFITWKRQQGIEVIEAYTSTTEVGSTTTSIKNYIQDVWDSASTDDPAFSYLLFVGDVEQIPAFNGTQGDADHVTDLPYAKLEGNDFIPEVMYARFSAQNTSQLQAILNKTIMYEKYQMPDPSYLGESVLIAGMDDNFASTHGNGQINYGKQQYFNANNGIEAHDYMYPQSGSNAANIINNLSNGVAYANYTAHGDWNEWCDPNLGFSDIDNFRNTNKYFLAVGNCCLTNKFEVDKCYGEALLRAENKGAIGYIGATNVSYWDEDYHWGVGNGPVVASGATYQQTSTGVYDGLFHTHAEEFAKWYTSQGSMLICGNLAVVESNSSRKNYYWEVYSLMGDPSLQPYLKVAEMNPASIEPVAVLGQENINVFTAPYARVALSYQGQLISTVLADANGNAALPTPVTSPMVADLVITAQNTEPIITTVEFIPGEGAYVVVDNFTIGDGTINNAVIGQTVALNINLENLGTENSSALTGVISSNSPYVQVLNPDFTTSAINSGSNFALTNAVNVKIADFVPDNTMVEFSAQITDGNDVWNSNFRLNISAPKLNYLEYSIVETANANGIIDAGEEVTLNITVENNGSAVATNVISQLINDFADVLTITPVNESIDSIQPDARADFTYTVQATNNVEEGTVVNLGFIASSGRYDAYNSILLTIGLGMEDFETGAFSDSGWQQGTRRWNVVSSGAYEGTYCAKSGTTPNRGESSFGITINLTSASSVSFYHKVSSELDYDFLRFYVNGNMRGEWSGTTSWQLAEYDLPAGEVSLEWKYEKDWNSTGGLDCAWVDNITLPGLVTGSGSIIGFSCDELNFTYNEGTWASQFVTIYNLGSEDQNLVLSIPNGFATDYEGSSPNITVGAEQTKEIEIRFVPTENRIYNENLLIAYGENFKTIALSGDATMVSADDNAPQYKTQLLGNYPNPFNPDTNIRFAIEKDSNVKLDIYNILGQKVKTLKNGRLKAGLHSLNWNGKDNKGNSVASGVYFYKLKTAKKVFANKMLLLK